MGDSWPGKPGWDVFAQHRRHVRRHTRRGNVRTALVPRRRRAVYPFWPWSKHTSRAVLGGVCERSLSSLAFRLAWLAAGFGWTGVPFHPRPADAAVGAGLRCCTGPWGRRLDKLAPVAHRGAAAIAAYVRFPVFSPTESFIVFVAPILAPRSAACRHRLRNPAPKWLRAAAHDAGETATVSTSGTGSCGRLSGLRAISRVLASHAAAAISSGGRADLNLVGELCRARGAVPQVEAALSIRAFSGGGRRRGTGGPGHGIRVLQPTP
jgi:hypothetical protein